MKRKLLLFVILCFVAFPLNAQSVIWEETFNSNPGTWNLDSNWNIQSGALMFSLVPVVTPYDLSATSPLITLWNDGELIISQFIDEYEVNNGEVANIEIVRSSSVDTLWSFDLVGNDWGSLGGTEISLSLSPYAGEQVQIRFRSYGESTFNLNYWYIYNIAINGYFDHDLAATDISGNSVLNIGEQGQWDIAVKNTGFNTESNYEVTLMREPGIILSSTIVTTPLGPDGEDIFSLNWTPDMSEVVKLYGQVNLTDDDFVNNNNTNLFQVNIYPDDPINILVWNNDNGSKINGVGTEKFIENALTANNVLYDTHTSLPSDLTSYDAIFVALGIYCVR